MKKTIILIGAFVAISMSANASTFGAGLKPKPFVKLFGQQLSWPIPSLCIGAKAGLIPDASVTPDGLNLKLPYVSLELPFPSLLVGGKETKVQLKLGEVSTTKQK